MMRVVFVGTSEFALLPLEAVSRAAEVPLVVTQPDRPRGRGRKLLPTPVKLKALELGIDVVSPERIKDAEDAIRNADPDVLVVVSYGQIIPRSILDIPGVGALNIHPSLLPKYRGAAPIQRAIMNGEKTTGVTIMWMNERLDAGDIFFQKEVEIGEDETYGELHDRLSELSAEMIVDALKRIEKGDVVRIPQNEEEATYAKPIAKEETFIDWKEGAERICNKIRALSPKPGAVAVISGSRFKIYRAKPCKGEGEPGEILEKDVRKGVLKIACGDGAVFVLEIQPEGKKKMDIASFLRGYGSRL
ncbi:MAG: methionyl-tRNA formyltransferase [Deferribacteres bacterium]|nr:methionyl-tRNA formyltransferase [Deferribacteres bacterium]